MKNISRLTIAFLLTLGSAFAMISCTENETNEVLDFEKGTVDASSTNLSIQHTESVTFTDLSTKVFSREWTFTGGDIDTSSDSIVTVTYAKGGSFTATLTVTFVDNTIGTKEFAVEVEGEPITNTPFSGTPAVIPGVLEFENYDKGGEGFAYHDTEEENKAVTAGSAEYRDDDGVDVQVSDDGSLINIGYSAADEWFEYTINVAEEAAYDFDFTLASGSSSGGSSVKIQLMDGETATDLGETGNFDNTGGWSAYTSLVVKGINLKAGTQVLRFYLTGGGVNLDKVSITSDAVVVAEKFGVYTESAVIGSVPYAIQENNGCTITTVDTDAKEGNEALYFGFTKEDTWGFMGSIKPADDAGAFTTADLSEYATGFYHISIKTTSPGKMKVRLQSDGVQGYVWLDDAVKTYGLERDGQWHSLKIPMADFKTDGGDAPDFAAITDLMIFRSEGSVTADQDWDWYVDDFYLTKE